MTEPTASHMRTAAEIVALHGDATVDLTPLQIAIATEIAAAEARGAAQVAALRDGFVAVPFEPTRAMWAAGGDAVMATKRRHHDIIVGRIWRDMLSAALSATGAAS